MISSAHILKHQDRKGREEPKMLDFKSQYQSPHAELFLL